MRSGVSVKRFITKTTPLLNPLYKLPFKNVMSTTRISLVETLKQKKKLQVSIKLTIHTFFFFERSRALFVYLLQKRRINDRDNII